MGKGRREDIQWVQNTGVGEVPRPAYQSVLGDLCTIDEPAIAQIGGFFQTLAVIELWQGPWVTKVTKCNTAPESFSWSWPSEGSPWGGCSNEWGSISSSFKGNSQSFSLPLITMVNEEVAYALLA